MQQKSCISATRTGKTTLLHTTKLLIKSAGMEPRAGLSTVEGAEFFLMLRVVPDAIHRGGRSWKWFWPCHTHVQQLMTRLLHKNRWQRTTDITLRCLQSTADKHYCHHLSLLQIQGSPLQLLIPTIRLGFILDFSSSWENIKSIFPVFLQCSGQRGKSDQHMVNQAFWASNSQLCENTCHAEFLQRFLTLFHNDTTEDKRWR